MQLDARLSRMLHILIHMDRLDGPMTSELAAQMLRTNPVVVRRTMAGLRDAGYVRSEKGHGGGWTLARPLDAIRILDIYRAVGEPRIFSIGPATPIRNAWSNRRSTPPWRPRCRKRRRC